MRGSLGRMCVVNMSKLTGINKRQAFGRWYVSIRSTGVSILKGWEGSKAELARYMKTVEFRKLYLKAIGEMDAAANVAKTAVTDNCTLGALLDWYQSDESPRWKKMGERTKKDYRKALACLKPDDLSYPAADLTMADMYRPPRCRSERALEQTCRQPDVLSFRSVFRRRQTRPRSW